MTTREGNSSPHFDMGFPFVTDICMYLYKVVGVRLSGNTMFKSPCQIWWLYIHPSIHHGLRFQEPPPPPPLLPLFVIQIVWCILLTICRCLCCCIQGQSGMQANCIMHDVHDSVPMPPKLGTDGVDIIGEWVCHPLAYTNRNWLL